MWTLAWTLACATHLDHVAGLDIDAVRPARVLVCVVAGGPSFMYDLEVIVTCLQVVACHAYFKALQHVDKAAIAVVVRAAAVGDAVPIVRILAFALAAIIVIASAVANRP